MADVQISDVISALSDLLSELIDGTPSSGGYILNPQDPGLLASLDRLSAADASASVPGAATTIAAHVDHVQYGVSLFNRWSHGERDPFSSADWSESWKRTTVSNSSWASLREELGRELHAWRSAIKTPRPMNDVALKGVISSVAHLAYHLGAIRQMDQRIRGPREQGL